LFLLVPPTGSLSGVRCYRFDVEQWKLVRLYPVPVGLRRVRQQYRYFRWRFPYDTLFFRVGRFFEFYEAAGSPQLACLGMQKMRWNRRGARHGFPSRNFTRALSTVLERGDAVLLIGETNGETGALEDACPCTGLRWYRTSRNGRAVGNLVTGAIDRAVSFPDQSSSDTNGNFIPSVQFVRPHCQWLFLADGG
jgi:hypothetical protein